TANFRVGRFGRFEWDWEGETYYRPFLPPSLQEMVAPAEFVQQAMARAGVDRAVLQNARPYGRLNDVFAEAVRVHPDRFIGLADDKKRDAQRAAELAELPRAARAPGSRGVYNATPAQTHNSHRPGFDAPLNEPFWERVGALGIPVFWELQGVP